MSRLPAGPQLPRFPRVVGYAMLAALATTGLFAADSAYRWYSDTGANVAAPQMPERSIQAAEPARVEAQPSNPAPQALAEKQARETPRIEERADDRPADNPTPDLATGPHPSLASAPAPSPVRGRDPNPASGSVPDEVTPQNKPTGISQQPKRQQAKRQPAKQQAAPDRVAPRRPAQAARPNVYWERDSQLGFAPQLRSRTCNPATGHMPMQCYYPREGRERFPSKPLN